MDNFFPLADQGNDGLNIFLNNIPSCHGTSPQAVCSWCICFTQHASTCGFYVHPYFYFRLSATSLMGFTCGFDIPPTTAIVGSPYIPTTSGVAAVTADMGIAAVSAAPSIDAVDSIPASASTQHDLPGHFQPKLDTMDIQIYNASYKKGVFLKDSPQVRILAQHCGRGYYCLYLIVAVDHPVNFVRQ